MSEQLIYGQVQEHLERLVPPRPPLVQQMERDARETGFPIVGPACGQFCYQVARMIGARRIFELGSGFGYSTAWFARAVQENGGGEVHHVVWDQELSRQARDHLGRLGLDEFVRYRIGEAVQALREIDGPFDLIFNDIDKHAYPDALPVIAQKLRPGGVLLADNALWHGRIFETRDRSADTEGVRRFTDSITQDPGWIVSIVPIRDGLLLACRDDDRRTQHGSKAWPNDKIEE